MTHIDVAEFENNFDAILERCMAGEMFTITENGVDQCVLLPIAEYERLTSET